MQPVEIMPRLDIKNRRVAQVIYFVEIVDAGDPVEWASSAYL